MLLGQRASVYDASRSVRLEGPVTRVEWVNPRAYVFLNVKDRAGTVVNWAVEIGNPLELERSDWTARSVAIGEVLTVVGQPARDASHRALATSVHSGARRLFTERARPATAKPGPAPRWPGGHVRLGAAPGERGYWEVAGTPQLFETAAGTIPMDAEGLLRNLSDADRVAPLQPWAKALYEYRQRTLLRDDPALRCQPPGGPRQFQTPHGIQFVEQPELGRILVLLGGGNRNWRTIATDGRAAAHPEDVVLTYYGTSVGKWEGDTLVVDSVGFNESFWFANGGLPHTEALHLIERFTRTDRDTLRYEVTVDDPRTYTRPWTGGWTLRWVADRDIEEFFCEENVESTLAR
jgi:hypothetical protein